MHAYDLAKLRGEIVVRLASAAERLILLDGKEIEAASDVLFITDREGPVGLAGIMGGGRTAISAETTDVFLEVAYFTPGAVRGRARRFGLLTDASQRFERGVDPAGQERAANRAVALITSIAGGRAGPVEITQSREHLSKTAAVSLRRSQVQRLLGMPLKDEQVRGALEALQMSVTPNPQGWEVTPPSYRFDIAIEADLIEEVARIVGYNEIPERDALAPQRFHRLPESRPREQSVLESLAVRGYLEAITFAFVDPALQEKLFPDRRGLALANPIASDLAVMRVSLWPGLLRAALENQRRQQDRIRLFEHGARFAPADGSVHEVDSLAGIAVGNRLPEQWSLPRDMRAPVDFFDVKGDLEALLAGTGTNNAFRFEPAALSCLHPGRSARLWRGELPVGWVGELHPSLVRELDFTYPPVLFELDVEEALAVGKPQYREVSRFPQVRRDLSVVVDEKVALSALAERVTLSSSSLLRDLLFFDVYRGPGVEAGRKSVALGLIFQDISRTLTDEDVERLIAAIVADLRVSLNAQLRE
jgi:phenylalanyl-tRNA synthetase beta chain